MGSGGVPGPACHGAMFRPGAGPGRPIYGLFRRWQRDGTWKRILAKLEAKASRPPSRSRTTRPPTGARRDPRAAGHPPLNKEIDKQRHVVATRSDKLAVRYEAAVTIAAIDEWL
jgi:transposase